MTDPLAVRRCKCGWPRPLFAIRNAQTGAEPAEPLEIRYDCPQCGARHTCGELATEDVRRSDRARALAWPFPLPSRRKDPSA